MRLKIAIQGIEGSNHHQVAKEYFSNHIRLVECPSFDDLVDQLLEAKAEKGVMAIENSIAGSIITNYALIYHHQLQIVGEYYLTVSHNLMALPGQTIDDISEVRSHPMALSQCKRFLRQYAHIKLVEDSDTAEPARQIQTQQLQQIAAIAPKMAADLYRLNIIAPDIQTVKNNATRFIIVQAKAGDVPKSEINKASIRFVTEHKKGSLAAVLNAMSDCELNLTKIQSLPIIETPWKYAFFVDFTFDQYSNFDKAKSLLDIMSEDFTVLGEYQAQS